MVVQELIAKLGFDVDQGGLNSVDNALGNFAKKLTLAAAGIYAVKKAVEATVWAISGSIEAAAQKEDVTTQFKVMLGDLEAAKYLYQEINQYAAVSPFETAGLAENVKLMMAFGMSAKDAFDDLKKLGDVALGDQNKMNHIALAYAQTKAAGRLTGNDLLQYVNAGFNPLEYIAKKTGKSADYWKKEMSKGKVSFDMVRQAFVDATSEGGKFYKGAEEGSKTWNGMLSTARDNIRMMAADIGDKMLPYLKELLRTASDLWDKFKGTGNTIAEMIGVFLDSGPNAISVVEMLAWAFQRVADSIGGAMILWEQFMLDIAMGKVAVYSLAGIFRDWYDFVGLGIAHIFSKVFKLLGWAGDKLGISSLSGFKSNAATVDGNIADYSPGRFTKAYTADAAAEVSKRAGTIEKLWDLIGTRQAGAPKMELTDQIKKILAGQSGKQPVTINNQTNNLTINADDPIKMMGEAAAGKFFQSAFIQLRHATV